MSKLNKYDVYDLPVRELTQKEIETLIELGYDPNNFQIRYEEL